MKRFGSIFRFEFMNYARNKAFVAITLVLVIAVAAVLCFPRIKEAVGAEKTPEPSASDEGESGEGESDEQSRIAVAGLADEAELSFFQNVLPDAAFTAVPASEDALRDAVTDGTYDAAVVVTGELSYRYIVKNVELYDTTEEQLSAAMLTRYQASVLAGLGAEEAQITQFLSAGVDAEIVRVEGGKDQMSNFFYTYILIFALYMVILLYGQFVASGVANEKSSRAMELLITSAEPRELLFGKVFGTGCAGLMQFVLIFGSGFLFYRLNASYYTDNFIIQSVFNMPLSMLLYAFLFLVLGFFLYAFLYGALGSMVSRLEQLNTAIMPVTFLFVIAFLIVMLSMSAGAVDSVLMKVASFVPFTSPMAMFTRLAMDTVAPWEIVVSVVLLVATTIGIGFLAAMLYRMGVLMYGQPPKPKELLVMLRERKQQNAR